MSSNVSFYISAFNELGQRISSKICKSKPENAEDEIKKMMSEFPQAKTVEVINADDFNLYLKGYVRGKNGIPVPFKEPEPTETEKEKERTDKISQKYKKQIEELQESMTTAMLAGDDELISDLKEEYKSVMDSYKKELGGKV